MTLIQYNGTSDEVTILKGEDWHGRLVEPLEATVVFDHSNNHTIDSEKLGISEEAVKLILGERERFTDVSALKTIPLSNSRRLWGGADGEVVAPILAGPTPDVNDDDPSVLAGDPTSAPTTLAPVNVPAPGNTSSTTRAPRA